MSKKPKKPKGGKRGAGKRQQQKQAPKPAAKPAAPQAAAPAPAKPVEPAKAPAAQGQGTKDPKATCPQAVRHPCDVTEFKVKVLPKKRGDSTDDPAGGKIEMIVKKPMRSPEPAETARLRKIVGHPMSLLLQQYDFVIETVASFHFQSPTAGSSTGPETTIDIEAEATYEGKCATAQHPRMHMRPATTPGGQRVKLDPQAPPLPQELVPTALAWPVGVKKIQIEKLQALSTSADLFMGNDAVTTLFRMIFFVLSMNQSVDIELWADSEGVPVDPARKPNRLLNGLVRVFRDVQIGIAITIPLGKKVTEELKVGERLDQAKKGIPLEGKREEKDFRHGFKHEQPRNDHGWSFGKLETLPADRYSIAFKLNDFEITLKEDDKSWADKKKEVWTDNKERAAAAAGKVKAGAQRAATEAQLAYELRDFLTLADYLQVAWHHLVQGIKGVRSAMEALITVFKKVPQLGFKFEYEFTFLALGASVTFSRKSSSAIVEGRCVPLKINGKIEVKLTLVEVKATLSFGLLIDLIAVRIEARVYGTIGGSVEATIECSLLDDTKAGFAGKATGKLGAVFEARALWKVYRREIAIETGFVTEGGLTWKGADKKLQWEFKMRSLPVQWYIVATDQSTGESRPKYYTLCEPRTIYKGEKTWDIK